MKIGLVLAGGGGRGAYEIGVWKALRELEIDKYIQVVAGTSIGALNAVLFLQGDLDKAEEVWYGISKNDVLPTDNFDLMKKGVLLVLGSKNINFIKKYMPKSLEQGNLSRKGLVDIMDNYIDFSKIIKSGVCCYATCSEVPSLKPKYFKLNNYSEAGIRRILLATSAIPIIYESEEINCRKYLDGSMGDNVPVQPVYGEGCDVIIVVQLEKQVVVQREKFPNAKIIEIVPSEIDVGILSGTLDFTQEGIKKRIQQGYDDTKNLLEPIFELSRYKLMKIPEETVVNVGRGVKDIFFKMYNKTKGSEKTINE